MLCKEVFLGPLQLSLLLNFLGQLDNIESELLILILLCLFNHRSQVYEILISCLKVVHHVFLWWHLRLIHSSDAVIDFAGLLRSDKLEGVCLGWVDEVGANLDSGSHF